MGRRTRTDMQEIDKSAYTCQKTAEQMGKESGPLHIDAQHERALTVAAHCVESTAELRPFQQDKHNKDYQKRNDHADLYVRVHIFADLIDGTQTRNNDTGAFQSHKRLVLHIKRIAVDNGRHTAGKEHSRQRYDKGLDIQIGNQITLNRTEQKPDP